MFEWLESEMSAIKTPRFHLIDGPADPTLQAAITQSNISLPDSYKRFVLKFGNAKLYRISRGGYRIGVFAGPRKAKLDDGTNIYHIGFHEGASVYVKPAANLIEFPLFEFEAESEEMVAENFESWLTASCEHARKAYGKERWAEILRGPKPFTAEEKEIIETRRLIRWRLLGVDTGQNHIFEITNTSQRTLPALTIGIRSKDGRLNGSVCLDIRHIGPGQTGVLHTSCYKGIIPPTEIETFELSDPQPEDRDQYWEFEVNRTSVSPERPLDKA